MDITGPPAGGDATAAGGEGREESVAGASTDPDAPPPAAGASSPTPGGSPPPAAGAGPRRPRPIFLGLGLLLALGMTIGLVIGFSTTTASTGSGHEAVPTFALPRVGGTGKVGVPLDGGANGHPAILLFFASWCDPCQKEIPKLARIYDQQRAEKSKLDAVSVIGVDGSDPTKNALAFMSKSKVTFPVAADKVYAVTQGKFGFTALPESVFVNGNGTIAKVHYGALSASQFVSWERKLLASA